MGTIWGVRCTLGWESGMGLSGCDCMYSGILLFTLYTHLSKFPYIIVNPSQSGLTSFNISQNLHRFSVL